MSRGPDFERYNVAIHLDAGEFIAALRKFVAAVEARDPDFRAEVEKKREGLGKHLLRKDDRPEVSKEKKLALDLEHVLNKHGIDSRLDTPDFILARYLVRQLAAYESARHEVSQFFGEPKKRHQGQRKDSWRKARSDAIRGQTEEVEASVTREEIRRMVAKVSEDRAAYVYCRRYAEEATLEELCEELAVSRDQIRRWQREGEELVAAMEAEGPPRIHEVYAEWLG